VLQILKHNPNGRFVTVCGDGEYVVYTALAWRNKSFGSALDFVWSADSNEYAIREQGAKVRCCCLLADPEAKILLDFMICHSKSCYRPYTSSCHEDNEAGNLQDALNMQGCKHF
jgi:hypothetical protein